MTKKEEKIIPQQQKEEIVFEQTEEVKELHVQIPGEMSLSEDEIKKIANKAANDLLDTMSGDKAVTKSISSHIKQSIRQQQIQRIQKTNIINEIWQGNQ